MAYYYDRENIPLMWEEGLVRHYYPGMDLNEMTPFQIIQWANLALLQIRQLEIAPYSGNDNVDAEVAEDAWKEMGK
jgi:hypothetical protein